MASEYCPRCGAPRVGALRYCRSCQFDFDDKANLPGQGMASPRRRSGGSSLAPRRGKSLVALGVVLIVALVGALAFLIAWRPWTGSVDPAIWSAYETRVRTSATELDQADQQWGDLVLTDPANDPFLLQDGEAMRTVVAREIGFAQSEPPNRCMGEVQTSYVSLLEMADIEGEKLIARGNGTEFDMLGLVDTSTNYTKARAALEQAISRDKGICGIGNQ
jgi:hypothetical protein